MRAAISSNDRARLPTSPPFAIPTRAESSPAPKRWTASVSRSSGEVMMRTSGMEPATSATRTTARITAARVSGGRLGMPAVA